MDLSKISRICSFAENGLITPSEPRFGVGKLTIRKGRANRLAGQTRPSLLRSFRVDIAGKTRKIPLMTYFNAADWAVIGGYLVGIIGLGVWFGKDQKTTRDYFLGSRNIPWWGIGLSIVAAETSALTIIGTPGMAYGSNLGFLQMVFGYVIARVLLAIFLVPHYFKGEIYSPYQLFKDRFGPAAGKLSGGFFLVSETLAAGVRVYVACIPIQLMLGINVLPAIVLFILLSLIYTFVGGVKAVIWTDALQFGLFLAGGIYTLFFIPTLIDGGWSTVLEKASAAGKSAWFNPHFSLLKPFNIWAGLIGGTFMTLSTHGAEQLIVQRVLACRSVADGRKALILSALVIFPLFAIFLWVGVALFVLYPEFPPGAPQALAAGVKKTDYIYPLFILNKVPHLLKGFLIVAILSAAMSSVSSALTSLASVSTMDFFKPLLRPRSEEFYLKFSKYSTAVWALALILVAYLSREVKFVMDAAFSLRGLTSGALLGGLFAAIFMRSATFPGLCAGMISSSTVMVIIFKTTEVYWPWYTLIGTMICVGVILLMRKSATLKAVDPG